VLAAVGLVGERVVPDEVELAAEATARMFMSQARAIRRSMRLQPSSML
jgi:hypothetical protein